MNSRPYRFRRSQRLPGVKADDLYAFHLDTRNFRHLVLPTTRVVTGPPPDVRPGAGFDLHMRELGVFPIHWPGVWNIVEPDNRLVDSLRQPAFPFACWRHEHRFENTCDGAILTDEIRFSPRLPGLLGCLAPAVAVVLKTHLAILFAWRHRVTRSRLKGPQPDPGAIIDHPESTQPNPP